MLRDELGRPVADGTSVIFGISPPNRETTTYTATINNGHARFNGVTLEAGDTAGSWLVTALVTLPSGIELRADTRSTCGRARRNLRGRTERIDRAIDHGQRRAREQTVHCQGLGAGPARPLLLT